MHACVERYKNDEELLKLISSIPNMWVEVHVYLYTFVLAFHLDGLLRHILRFVNIEHEGRPVGTITFRMSTFTNDQIGILPEVLRAIISRSKDDSQFKVTLNLE